MPVLNRVISYVLLQTISSIVIIEFKISKVISKRVSADGLDHFMPCSSFCTIKLFVGSYIPWSLQLLQQCKILLLSVCNLLLTGVQ